MSRRRSSAARTTIVRVPSAPARRAPAPVIKLNLPRAASPRRVGRKVRRGVRRAASHAFESRSLLVPLATAFALGKAEQAGMLAQVPRVFGMGPVGSAAVISYGVSKWLWKTPTARNVALCLGIIALNRFGATGQIAGDDSVVGGFGVVGGYPGGAAVVGSW